MSDYISKSALLDFLKEEIKQDRPDDFKIRNIQRYIEDIPTLDEKEIIRKPFERVVERLKEAEIKTEEKFHYLMDMIEEHSLPCEYDKSDLSFERLQTFGEAIEIIKEECGISE